MAVDFTDEALITHLQRQIERARTLPRFIIDEQRTMIVCLDCGSVSYNANDIRERYCGHCHKFHDL